MFSYLEKGNITEVTRLSSLRQEDKPTLSGWSQCNPRMCDVCTQSCLTICDPIDCNPPGFSVHGILQARILGWVAFSYSRASFLPKDRTLLHLLHWQADSSTRGPPPM